MAVWQPASWPDHQDQFGVGVLPEDTSTCGQEEILPVKRLFIDNHKPVVKTKLQPHLIKTLFGKVSSAVCHLVSFNAQMINSHFIFFSVQTSV